MSDDEGGDGYRFARDLSGQSLWTRVEGGDLPMPVELIFGSAPDGRYVVAGLKIEDAWYPEVVTSATLRQIKLGEIQAAYFDYFEPIRLMEESLAELSHPILPPKPGPHGPDNEALRAFAHTYLTELARQPHRAMTATAKAHHISRTTANRWAALCRELGYLPSFSGEEHES
ncbi:MAG TPA: hypothetical protein VF070_13150 [Streptosporangiaceae bacterium]